MLGGMFALFLYFASRDRFECPHCGAKATPITAEELATLTQTEVSAENRAERMLKPAQLVLGHTTNADADADADASRLQVRQKQRWEVFHDDVGQPYYRNIDTGDTTWEISADAVIVAPEHEPARRPSADGKQQGAQDAQDVQNTYDERLDAMMTKCEHMERLVGSASFRLVRCSRPECARVSKGRAALWLSGHHDCSHCDCRTSSDTVTTLVAATETHTGRQLCKTDCRFCGAHSERVETVPRIQRSRSTSSRGFSGGGGSSGGSSWLTGGSDNESGSGGAVEGVWASAQAALLPLQARLVGAREAGVAEACRQWLAARSRPPPPPPPPRTPPPPPPTASHE